jgi:hypothetical protein
MVDLKGAFPMRPLALTVMAGALLSVTAAPATLACNDPAHLRAIRDAARTAQAQAKSMERQERLLREQNKLLDRQLRAQR